eukprot:jgi/Bigna1/91352/estExt_fgenesh1_pg.C_980012
MDGHSPPSHVEAERASKKEDVSAPLEPKFFESKEDPSRNKVHSMFGFLAGVPAFVDLLWARLKDEPWWIRAASVGTAIVVLCGIGCGLLLFSLIAAFIFSCVSFFAAIAIVACSWIVLISMIISIGVGFVVLPIASATSLIIGSILGGITVTVLIIRHREAVRGLLESKYRLLVEFAREKRATLNEVITDYRDGMLHQQQQKDE